MKKRNWLIVWTIIFVCFIWRISFVESCKPRWSCPYALVYGGETFIGGWTTDVGSWVNMEIQGEKISVPWLDAEKLVQVGVISEVVDGTSMPEKELSCNLSAVVTVGTPVYQMIVHGEYMYVIDYEWEKGGDIVQTRHFFREQ